MGAYDLTARRAAKRDPEGFLRWVLPQLDPVLAFTGNPGGVEAAILEEWKVLGSRQSWRSGSGWLIWSRINRYD
jgi:hypothetical protein